MCIPIKVNKMDPNIDFHAKYFRIGMLGLGLGLGFEFVQKWNRFTC